MLAGLTACSGEARFDGYQLADEPAPLIVAPEIDDFVLEYARSYGVGQLSASFTYHGPSGTSQSGKLLLRSHTDCQFAVIGLASGNLERTFGRCGDGPHETRTIAGAGIYADTVVFANVRSGLLRFVGPADTVARSLEVAGLVNDGTEGVHMLQVVDDSTLFVTLAVASHLDSLHPLFAFVDLRSGQIQPVPFKLSRARREKVPEARHFFGACTHRNGSTVVIENNGPAELLGVGSDGKAAWAIRASVAGIQLTAQGETPAPSSAFRWNRLPVRPACSAEYVLSRMIPLQGTDDAAPLGVMLLVRYNGTVAMNLAFESRDTVLALANWFADDSLFYVATTQAMSPRVLAFRPRVRRNGESGLFVLPEEIREALSQ
jgi:hypothetical protein